MEWAEHTLDLVFLLFTHLFLPFFIFVLYSSNRLIGSTKHIPKALYRDRLYIDIVLNRAIGANGKEYGKEFRK